MVVATMGTTVASVNHSGCGGNHQRAHHARGRLAVASVSSFKHLPVVISVAVGTRIAATATDKRVEGLCRGRAVVTTRQELELCVEKVR